jgi:hypothetical protein
VGLGEPEERLALAFPGLDQVIAQWDAVLVGEEH